MSGFLFEQVVFGPIKSRRLGISLGVNLLPLNRKVCTFNCLYCECGWTENADASKVLDFQTCSRVGDKMRGREKTGFPDKNIIRAELEQKLASMADKKAMLTNITFAGNGEPTLHPEFEEIVNYTIALRNQYYPTAGISVLSNATLADKESVTRALMKVDQNILKLDAGTDKTFQRINNPRIVITLPELIEKLKRFKGKMVIQTLFVQGRYQGTAFDNTTDAEVDAWLKHIAVLQPQSVMIYPIARDTPIEDVQKIAPEKLMEIARKVEALGIRAEVYG